MLMRIFYIMKDKDNKLRKLSGASDNTENPEILRQKLISCEAEIIRLKSLIRNRISYDQKEEISVDILTNEIFNNKDFFYEASFHKLFFDKMPFLMWVKDIDGNFIIANDTFIEETGFKGSSVYGIKDSDLLPASLAEKFKKDDLEVIKTGKQKYSEDYISLKNGTCLYEIIRYPFFSQNGKVEAIAGFAKDISDRKTSEQALLKSEGRFKDLVTLLPEVVFETDSNGNLTFVNQNAYDEYDLFPPDQVHKVNIFDLIAPEDIKRARTVFKNVKNGTEVHNAEYSVLTMDNKRIPVMVFTNNIYHNGEWNGIRGVAIDLSGKKYAEGLEKRYYSNILFLSDTALAFLDMPNAENIYVYTGEKLHELLSDSIIIVSRFSEEGSELSVEYLSHADLYLEELVNISGFRNGKFVLKLEAKHIDTLKDHFEHFYEFHNGIHEACFFNFPESVCRKIEKLFKINRINGMSLMRSGKLYGTVIVINDFIDPKDKTLVETFLFQASIALHRRQLENELIKAKENAENSDKLKTAFLANMSHEIRTPLNGILGLSQLLHNPRLSEGDKLEYLSLIQSNGKILLKLVNDIIHISQIESNQLDLDESAFSLEKLFKDIESHFRLERMMKKKEFIDFRIQKIPGNVKMEIIGDLQKIKQIFINLINNALKFTSCGEIEIGCSLKKKNTIVFFVRDTGIGIPSSKLKSVFERFTQVDQSLSRIFGGSGLGLAICKGFIERMSGKIWVHSKENEGSVFYFNIPYRPSLLESPPLEETIVTDKQYNLDKFCILVVEDNLISFKLLKILLEKAGAKVLHAEDGYKALEMIEQYSEINLVLMDIQLPGMNGYETTKKIKKLRPKLPVIAQTANAMEDDKLLCLNAGCSDYITKPIILERLYQTINNCLCGIQSEDTE